MSTCASCVSVLAMAIAVASVGRAQTELRDALDRAQRIRADLSKPFKVNGQALDPLEVERQVVYLVGTRVLQQKLIELIVEDQMEQQIKAGVPEKTFTVMEAAVRKQIQRTIDDWLAKNPGKDFYAEWAKRNVSPEEYLSLQRSTLLFDQVFFRGIPSKWPEITKEAIIAAGGPEGVKFFQGIADSVKEGQTLPPMFLYVCRTWVVQQMQKWADIRYASDGLPPAVSLSVNGKEWKTVDAARAVALKVKPEDRTRALVDVVLQTSLRQELQRAEAWLSDARFRKEFGEYKKPYEGTPFPVKVLALTFKGYPSYEVYKAWWRLGRSYEHLIGKQINDENLAKHLERAKAFLADGRASVDLIRIPAFDDATGTWRKNGFPLAKRRSELAMSRIVSGKLSFEQAMAEFGRWPEQHRDQGRLAGKSLNEIRTELRETEYSDLVHGFSVAEILFYDVKPGAVAGPFRGQDGYYIGRVRDRMPAAGAISLQDKNQRDLVKQDFVSHRFLAWANEVARRTVIE